MIGIPEERQDYKALEEECPEEEAVFEEPVLEEYHVDFMTSRQTPLLRRRAPLVTSD